MPWSTRFDAPIPVGDGKQLATLAEAVKHLSETVPASDHRHPKVLHAATSLAEAAEGRDFVMHARIAVIRALKRHDAPPPMIASGKKTHWGRRSLKRDE